MRNIEEIVKVFLASENGLVSYERRYQNYGRKTVVLPKEAVSGEFIRVRFSLQPGERVQGYHEPLTLSETLLASMQKEARFLRSLHHFVAEDAMSILEAKYGEALPFWKEHDHYYVSDDGTIYGSRFSPAGLFVFETLKRDNCLEFIMWLFENASDEKTLYGMYEKGEGIKRDEVITPSMGDADVSLLEKRAKRGIDLLSSCLLRIPAGGIPAVLPEDKISFLGKIRSRRGVVETGELWTGSFSELAEGYPRNKKWAWEYTLEGELPKNLGRLPRDRVESVVRLEKLAQTYKALGDKILLVRFLFPNRSMREACRLAETDWENIKKIAHMARKGIEKK